MNSKRWLIAVGLVTMIALGLEAYVVHEAWAACRAQGNTIKFCIGVE